MLSKILTSEKPIWSLGYAFGCLGLLLGLTMGPRWVHAQAPSCRQIYIQPMSANSFAQDSEFSDAAATVGQSLSRYAFRDLGPSDRALVIDPTNFYQADQAQFLFLGLNHVAQTFHRVGTFPDSSVIAPFIFKDFEAHMQRSVHVLKLGAPKLYTPSDFSLLPQAARPRTSFVGPQIEAFFRLAFRNVADSNQVVNQAVNQPSNQMIKQTLPLEQMLQKNIFDEVKFKDFTQVVELGRGAIDDTLPSNSLLHYTNTFSHLFNVLSSSKLDSTLVVALTSVASVKDHFVKNWGFHVERVEQISPGRNEYLIVARASDVRHYLLRQQQEASQMSRAVRAEVPKILEQQERYRDRNYVRQLLSSKILFRVQGPESSMIEIVMAPTGQVFARMQNQHYMLEKFSAQLREESAANTTSAVVLDFQFNDSSGQRIHFQGEVPLFTGLARFQKNTEQTRFTLLPQNRVTQDPNSAWNFSMGQGHAEWTIPAVQAPLLRGPHVRAEIPSDTLYPAGSVNPDSFFRLSDPVEVTHDGALNSHSSLQAFPFWRSLQYGIPIKEFLRAINP